MNILSVQNVTKVYTNKTALNQVSINIPEGSIYGLLGPNGAGKTTLIRIINQITAPDEGKIFFKDQPLGNEHIFKIGYLPEERGLYKKMEIADQMLYFAQLKGLTKAEAAKRIKYWFEKFEIMSWKNKKIEDLSKGMQQKVQFIATIIHEPELLILDEPFTGLDPVNADLIRDEILELKKKGTSVIFSTHRMESVETLCDYIALINLSNKVLDGKTSDIKKQYSSNTFNVVLEGEHKDIILPANSEIRFQNFISGNTELEIAIHQGNTNSVLHELLPYYTILQFIEKIPSINDIFKLKVAETGGVLAKM
jgi:ABC-2 type transport system ATP-binding protein